jgi:hypothetical protein
MSDLVRPYDDRNDDTESELTTGQEGSGVIRSMTSRTVAERTALSCFQIRGALLTPLGPTREPARPLHFRGFGLSTGFGCHRYARV